MSGEFKPGDRVHVEFDATVQSGPDGDGDLLLGLDRAIAAPFIPASCCTKIVPPVAVGDLVSAENVGQLTAGSVVAFPAMTYMRKKDGLWGANMYSPYGIGDDALVHSRVPLRVLRVGGGES